jgi:hypothetical protein
VGSCFATAPAILVQRDNPLLLLQDLYQLLSTGKLKRTFGGVEYALPLSPNTGIGDTRKRINSLEELLSCPGWQALHLPPSLDKNVETLIHKHFLKEEGLSENDLTSPLAHSPLEARVHKFEQRKQEALETFKAAADNPLLKAWEFTLASFSEVKMEFSRWNFYISLGFASEAPGGLGAILIQRVNEKIEETNKQLQECQLDYHLAFDQVRATEVLLRSASSEGDARRLRAEHQSRAYHMRACQEKRDALYERGNSYAEIPKLLMKHYEEQFPNYFQEIYDATMHDVQEGSYEDSPAGFRLVYKQGRTDPSTWVVISHPHSYIQALTDFFSLTQVSLTAENEEIHSLVAAMIHHLRIPSFLEGALQRMRQAHGSDAKPWAYTSGGTMTTLLKTYYCREGEFTSESKRIESPQELLIFIIDTLKNLSAHILDPFITGEKTGMLMSSPNHAFILLPQTLRSAWESDLFTYTWVRDALIEPGRAFYKPLSQQKVESLFDAFSSLYPDLVMRSPSSLSEWRAALSTEWQDRMDAFLFEHLPSPPALLVADSNWSGYFFAFLINPSTLELEFWRVNATLTSGWPMSSWRQHFKGKEWSILTRPSEYS